MSDKKYMLSYLPLFEKDLAETKKYVAEILKNPTAALRLIEETERQIQKRLKNPLAYEPYHSLKDRALTYYRIYVGNFIVFYVVIDNVMEVRRFIYSKRDLSKLI